jgi:tetratricopeptide (TPR) repeat protein
MVMLAEGHLDEALRYYRQALSLQPNDANTLVGLGTTLLKMGRTEEALKHLQEAARRDPLLSSAHGTLAHVFATHPAPEYRNPSNALFHAEAICRLTRFQSPSALEKLGEAYAASGRFEDAARIIENAWRILVSSGQSATASNQLAKKLDLYRKGHSYYDSEFVMEKVISTAIDSSASTSQ